jgi:hypothetical protein
MSEKAIIQKTEPYHYFIPIYTVAEGKGIELIDRNLESDSPTARVCGIYIEMLRGSKVEGENIFPKIDGVLVEQLLAVCIDHLKAVNVGELASRETSTAITHLETAGLWLMKRELDRKRNNVLGTYQK